MLDSYIYNTIILTMDAESREVSPGAVGLKDGQIREIHPWLDGDTLPPSAEYLDVQGGIVMPGLINSHTHLPMSLYRGLADDLPLEQWLQEHMFPVEARFCTEEYVPWAVKLSCAEMLLGGITTCCDGYFLAEYVAETVSRTGMRAVLAQGVIDFPAPGVPDPNRKIDVAKTFVKNWQGRSSLIHPSIFCHSPYTCSAETLISAHRAAVEAGVLFQIHVAETRTELENSRTEKGCSPVAYLDKLGLLTSNTLLVHAVWMDENDVDLIARSGAAVAHCPESNMKLAAGIAPVPSFLAAGIPVGLGTDSSASNNDLNVLKEMDTAAKLHKVREMDPTVMDAGTVLRMATGLGARAIGLHDDIGSLEPGKRADLIVLDLNRSHLTPMYHPASHIVYAAGAADVRHVMVDGRWIVKDSELLTFDTDEVLSQVNRIAREIKESLS